METIFKVGNKINLAYDGQLLLILANDKASSSLSVAWAHKSLEPKIIDELVVAIIEHNL